MMDESLKEENIRVITTISENDKSRVFLIVGPDEQLYVRKEIAGEDKTPLYERIKELHSQYFPQIFSIEYKNQKTCILEEYIEGTGLDKLLETDIAPDAGLDYMLQLVQAISELHRPEPPLIHRDVKPENIIVTQEGRLFLLDFDATREYSPEEREHDTRMLGTRGYASPEQFGFAQTDVRSDIYSAGIVCSRIAEKMELPIFQKKKLKKVLDRATMFDPDRRFQNAEQMLVSLRRVKGKKRNVGNKGRICMAILLITLLSAGLMCRSRFAEKGEAYDISPDPVKIYNRLILPREYVYTPLGSQWRTETEALFSQSPELKYIKTDVQETDGGTGGEWECPLGTEYFCFHYMKAYPQALFFYDADFEGRKISDISLERYSSNGERLVEKIHLLQQKETVIKNGCLCIETQVLNELNVGLYVLTVKDDEWEWKCYLQVHGEEEEIGDYVVYAQSPVQFYSRRAQNDIFLNMLNTPYRVSQVYCNDSLLPESRYLMTGDGRGVIFKADFFREYTESESVELMFLMRNGRKAYGRVLILP